MLNKILSFFIIYTISSANASSIDVLTSIFERSTTLLASMQNGEENLEESAIEILNDINGKRGFKTQEARINNHPLYKNLSERDVIVDALLIVNELLGLNKVIALTKSQLIYWPAYINHFKHVMAIAALAEASKNQDMNDSSLKEEILKKSKELGENLDIDLTLGTHSSHAWARVENFERNFYSKEFSVNTYPHTYFTDRYLEDKNYYFIKKMFVYPFQKINCFAFCQNRMENLNFMITQIFSSSYKADRKTVRIMALIKDLALDYPHMADALFSCTPRLFNSKRTLQLLEELNPSQEGIDHGYLQCIYECLMDRILLFYSFPIGKRPSQAVVNQSFTYVLGRCRVNTYLLKFLLHQEKEFSPSQDAIDEGIRELMKWNKINPIEVLDIMFKQPLGKRPSQDVINSYLIYLSNEERFTDDELEVAVYLVNLPAAMQPSSNSILIAYENARATGKASLINLLKPFVTATSSC